MIHPPERARRSADRLVAGVAGGWADRWGVDPTVVRAALALTSLVGGLGIVAYGVMAWWSRGDGDPETPPPGVDSTRRSLAIALAIAAILVVARAVGVWPGDEVMVAVSAVAVGLAVAWSRRQDDRLTFAARVLAGVVLLGAGVISLAQRTGGLGNVGASVGAIAIVVVGLALFAAPALGRLLRTLDDERSARIREDERSIVAAHLHDSVLQSLVLIQRSDDPRRMANLARRQERELRSWLYGGSEPTDIDHLHAAVAALTREVEADHDVRVEAVVVGDHPLDDQSRALVAALREAIVNSARHSGVDQVDVFVEADSAELRGFVRDTGCGFDATTVSTDRHGIRESIVGRVRRHDGEARVISTPGGGTEVEIRVPVVGR